LFVFLAGLRKNYSTDFTEFDGRLHMDRENNPLEFGGNPG